MFKINLRPFACELCDKRFKLKSHLTQHEFVHKSSEKDNSCPIPGCASSFRRSWHLKEHMDTHNGLAKHRCSFPGCSKAYQGRSNLVIHERSHTGERPFACAQCNRCFSSKGNLIKHQKRHSAQNEKEIADELSEL